MSKTRIMVVEDERIVALNLKQRLTKLGYDVSAMATSGEQALREAASQPPDLVLMDINIEGGMDGIETASKLPGDPQIPVIYLTAYSDETTLERARTTRPYGFLLKPFSERELHATIQMVLERRRSDVMLKENEQRLEALVEQRSAELLKAEEALRQVQKMEAIGQLTGGLAHDFNNLLQGITGSLSLIQYRIIQGRLVGLETIVGSAMSSAERAAALVHRLLAFSRRQPLDPRPVSVNQLAGDMAELVRQTGGEKVEVQFFLADDLWLTRCDGNQLESAILNLAINARDAMPDGGKITIETANAELDGAATAPFGVPAGNYVCVSVSDTGIGMKPDVLARAFEPFYTTKPIGQGTGLGLSMIYGFVLQSRGFTKLYSELGHGTTVRIYLPQFNGALLADEESGRVPPIQSTRNGEVVLVVEDDPVVRRLLVELLGDLGYSPLEAADGPAGLALLQSGVPIDLLVTDIGLPGLNGRQVADGGRETRPELKVLFMTGYAEQAAMANGFLEPGMHLITKPFTLDAMAARIREMVAV